MQIHQLPFLARAKIVVIFSVILFNAHVIAETNEQTPLNMKPSTSSGLGEILSLSLSKAYLNTGNDKIPDYQSSSWLSTSPGVIVNYLKSQQDLGADEIEVGINLTIKSALQRNLDSRLVQLDNQISTHQQNIRKLYFSGLIRESLWSHKIAKVERTYLDKKLSVLKQLASNKKALVNAGEISDYGLLLIKKELITTQIEGLENQREIQLWQDQYQNITGTHNIPDNIFEKKFSLNNWSSVQHPMGQLLEKRWQQAKLINRASSNEAAPWTVGISAKRIDTPDMTDDQIGISFEMPVNMIKTESQTIKNQSSQAKQQFDSDYKKLVLQIEQQVSQHKENTHFLKSKQELLKKSVELSQHIMNQIDRLDAKNELGVELILRRVMDAVKTRHEYTLTNILIQQNNAMSRQAAGISL